MNDDGFEPLFAAGIAMLAEVVSLALFIGMLWIWLGIYATR